ncbi:hypothetical protein [Chryseobacterium profundimaris]|uniref:Transmembrane protein n=1 Tax=Chryseobacterium profundimaris TaxID=1387275 RepID=A0ABY1NI81_9FLAO|nr:hypothetical protein [Chryseobacterium profundimaris]SMP09746.1 hypothetical protein SAMN06264346_10297 [Chryseobacterium profundimaris]
MKNIQLLGLILVVAGSFLPLVHIPVIGNWNYWKLDHFLAIACWVLTAGTLFGIVNNSPKITRIFAFLLVVLFLFTLSAVKFQASQYFSFMPFTSWQDKLAGIVQLKWGWIVEFLGAFIIIFASGRKND